MHITDIIAPDRVLVGLAGGSKKRVLEFFSKFIAQNMPSLDSGEVFANLVARERLGSTGIGHGVAIPHCRISHCQHAVGTFIKLRERVDFDAIDGDPVDLIFILLVPEHACEEHLHTLAMLAKLFSDEDMRRRLRQTDTNPALFELLSTAIPAAMLPSEDKP